MLLTARSFSDGRTLPLLLSPDEDGSITRVTLQLLSSTEVRVCGAMHAPLCITHHSCQLCLLLQLYRMLHGAWGRYTSFQQSYEAARKDLSKLVGSVMVADRQLSSSSLVAERDRNREELQALIADIQSIQRYMHAHEVERITSVCRSRFNQPAVQVPVSDTKLRQLLLTALLLPLLPAAVPILVLLHRPGRQRVVKFRPRRRPCCQLSISQQARVQHGTQRRLVHVDACAQCICARNGGSSNGSSAVPQAMPAAVRKALRADAHTGMHCIITEKQAPSCINAPIHTSSWQRSPQTGCQRPFASAAAAAAAAPPRAAAHRLLRGAAAARQQQGGFSTTDTH